MLVGVLADTHVRGMGRALPDELWAAFEGVEAILHAGDLVSLTVRDVLQAHAPTHAVAGNSDGYEVAEVLPERRVLALGEVRVGLTHGHLGAGRTTPERALRQFADEAEPVAVVVFGHSHQPLIERRGGVLLVNPGSPLDRRSAPRYSCARLWLAPGAVEAELVEWD